MNLSRPAALMGALSLAVVSVTAIGWIPGVAWNKSAAETARAEEVSAKMATAALALPDKVTFNAHVQPILSEYCYHCHGPDSGSRKAELRLDRAEFAFKKLKNGQPPIIKGQGAASEVVKRMRHKDPKEVMPPPEVHKEMPARDIALLEKWINQGANYEEHWSFLPPKKSPVPAVRNTAWPRNPVDSFLLARLEKEGLSPAAEADKPALIRRVTLDLTGLPPTPAEVDAFVADTRPDAYEKLVDGLLASASYGEQQARYWLDAARYADTHGIHIDNYRSIWPYRDWVIKSFNSNQPFDQFTVEQLAGDLLPDPTLDQQIATGFHRCLPTTGEGGAIADEYLAIYAKDRVETTAQVWLGLTAGCAACHDHKFDPVSQKDFYQLTAFFRNTPMSALDGNSAEHAPNLLVPAVADRPRWDELAKLLPEKEKALKAAEKDDQDQLKAYLSKLSASGVSLPDAPADTSLHLTASEGKGATVNFQLQGAASKVDLKGKYKWVMHGPVQALAPGDNFNADLGDFANFSHTQAFSYGAWVRSENLTGALLSRMDEASDYAGWDFWFENNSFGAHLINKWEGNAIKLVSETKVPANEWSHVMLTYDGSSKAAGVRLYLNGEQVQAKVERDTLTGPLTSKAHVQLGRRTPGQPFVNGAFHDLRLYTRAVRPEEVSTIALAPFQKHLKSLAIDKLGPSVQSILATRFKQNDASSAALRQEVANLQAEREAIKKRGVITLVMKEKGEEPSAYILNRGDYSQKKDKVGADVPAVFSVRMGKDDPQNRLGLARWLVNPGHPLTARVTVNRFWQQIFGTGLVPSSQDFGVMGERPTNPELLDWLAVEFRESGWDVKKLMKLLVTTSAYRQSAVATAAKIEKDGTDRLLSRGPRQRMDGEMIRDQALFASGLLVDKQGGPSVKPYQPDGVWESVAMKESNTRNYKRESGDALYRRSLYTFWKRSAPHPALEAFGTPTRENCTVRRERTNTPLQALVTLNDVQFVEAARVLAERVLKTPGDDEKRFELLFRLVLSRGPRANELPILSSALTDFRAHYGKTEEDAKKLIGVGESVPDKSLAPAELAAWTLLASKTLNLDEALNK